RGRQLWCAPRRGPGARQVPATVRHHPSGGLMMSVDSAIRRFRRSERRLMTSTVEVTRVTGEPSYDPGTGTVTEPTSTVYHGDALVRMNAWEGSDVQAGDTEVRLRTARAKLPANTLVLRDDRL